MIDEFGVPHFKAIAINETFTILEREIGQPDKPEPDPASRSKVIRTKDFMDRIAEKFKGRSIDLIPKNCRYIEPIQGGKIVVIEEPPQARTILTSIDVTYQHESLISRGLVEEYGYKDFFKSYPTKKSETTYRFTLAFPYLIFIFRLTDKNEYASGKVFFRKKPLLGMGEILFKAPLYNINNDQGLCIGHDGSDGPANSVNQGCLQILNRFWGASFNHDYNANISAYQNVPIVNNFFDWEYHTRQNPLFIYNVDFLPNKDGRKLIDEIRFFRGESVENPSGRSIFSFQALIQSFEVPVLSDHTVKDPVYGEITTLMDNIAHGIMGSNGLTADVGDRLKMKDFEYVIESFLGPETGYDPTHIKLFSVGKNSAQVYKLSAYFKKKIFDAIFEYRLMESIEFSGIKISKSDIVLMKKRDGREFYKRVEYIRRNIDGLPEIKLGDEFITPTMFGSSFVKKVELEKLSLRGSLLNKGDEFYLVKQTNAELPLVSADEVIYDGASVQSGAIGLLFKLSKTSASLAGTSSQFISLNNFGEYEKSLVSPAPLGTLIRKDEVITLPPIFRYFRSLYSTKYSLTSTKMRAVKNKYFIHQHNDTLQNGTLGDNTKITKTLLVDDALVIKSYDVDIEYRVGEKVIVADWEHPEKLLIPKIITGFKSEIQEKVNATNISLVLSDKQGGLEVIPFISYDGKIATGRIRKIIGEMNGIKAGTKIIANEANIYCFPKKDVNIIVGFLVDTVANEPLVLCSNGLTLWLSDLTQFTLIPFTSRRWKTLDHVPIVDQYTIKLQPGDVVRGNTGYGVDDFLVFKHIEAKTTLRAMLFSYFHSYAESIAISNNFRYSVSFDCIPNPRISTADAEKLGYVIGYPNLFGGINPNPISTQQFIADPRSIVQ